MPQKIIRTSTMRFARGSLRYYRYGPFRLGEMLSRQLGYFRREHGGFIPLPQPLLDFGEMLETTGGIHTFVTS